MFDTERFIIEVQNRICLWNISEKSYGDRDSKNSAWKEIAELLTENWDNRSDSEKESIGKIILFIQILF